MPALPSPLGSQLQLLPLLQDRTVTRSKQLIGLLRPCREEAHKRCLTSAFCLKPTASRTWRIREARLSAQM